MTAGNTLGIGTMGFGGQVTLIGCKVGVLNRLPASFFVSVAYDCWAFRRLGVILDAKSGALKRWLYREDKPAAPMAAGEGFPRTGKEVRLQAPLTAEKVRGLKMGDVVLVSGEIYTGRDAVHAYLMKHDSPVKLQGSVLYHCGPVVLKDNGHYRITAAGPTTSIREEPYQAEIIERFGIRAVMGKGGMGARTLAGLKASGGRLPERHRRGSPVLLPLHRGGAGRPPAGIRHSRGHVAHPGQGPARHRHHGLPRQFTARRRPQGILHLVGQAG